MVPPTRHNYHVLWCVMIVGMNYWTKCSWMFDDIISTLVWWSFDHAMMLAEFSDEWKPILGWCWDDVWWHFMFFDGQIRQYRNSIVPMKSLWHPDIKAIGVPTLPATHTDERHWWQLGIRNNKKKRCRTVRACFDILPQNVACLQFPWSCLLLLSTLQLFLALVWYLEVFLTWNSWMKPISIDHLIGNSIVASDLGVTIQSSYRLGWLLMKPVVDCNRYKLQHVFTIITQIHTKAKITKFLASFIKTMVWCANDIPILKNCWCAQVLYWLGRVGVYPINFVYLKAYLVGTQIKMISDIAIHFRFTSWPTTKTTTTTPPALRDLLFLRFPPWAKCLNVHGEKQKIQQAKIWVFFFMVFMFFFYGCLWFLWFVMFF